MTAAPVSTPPRCALDPGCEAVATARIAVSRRPNGAIAYLTAVPITLASASGAACCADCLHSKIDGMLMNARGPATPPDVETLPEGEKP